MLVLNGRSGSSIGKSRYTRNVDVDEYPTAGF